MMKKQGFILLLITAAIFICGCGLVKEEDYNNLLAEKEKAEADCADKISALNNEIKALNGEIDGKKSEIKTLNDEIESQRSEISVLESKIDELKNGEDRKYSEILNLFEAGKYSEVIESAESFHKKYNGSDKDIKVQELVKKCQSEIDRIAEEKRKADEAAAEEARKSAEEKAREIIRVTKVYVSRPDSAGGVELYINFKNNSDKVIKYVDFNVAMYNAVGDIDLGEYEHGSFVKCRATGPYKKGQGVSGTGEYWGKYYSFQIKSAKLVGVTIIYMDGTIRTLTTEEVGYVQY